MAESDRNFIDYIYILVKWRKQIIKTFFIVCIVAAGISLFLPKVHRGVTTIMPPADDTGGLGLSSLISQIPLSGLGLGAMSDETYAFLAILNSRTVMESVVHEFNLVERYHVKNVEKAIKRCRERIKIDVNEDGRVAIKDIIDKTEDKNLTYGLASALGEFRHEKTITLLSELAEKGRYDTLRYKSIQSLMKLEDKGALEALKYAALNDPDKYNRAKAIIAIGQIGNKDQIPFLIEAKDKEADSFVKHVSEQQIRNLTER